MEGGHLEEVDQGEVDQEEADQEEVEETQITKCPLLFRLLHWERAPSVYG